MIPINKRFFIDADGAEIGAEVERAPMSDARFRAILRLVYTAIGSAVSIAAMALAGPLALFAIVVVVLVALCSATD